MTPDAGIEAFREPYPRLNNDPDGMRMVIHGGHPVDIIDLRGTWAHVVVEGTDCGWVNGQLLVPPTVATTATFAGVAPLAQPESASHRWYSLAFDSVLGASAGVAIIIGAFLEWARRASLNSFKIPVQFLFDPHTTSEQPRLGWFVLAVGVLGAVFSFFPGLTMLRVLFGVLGLGIGALYMISVARALNDAGSTRSFTDLVGAGPWLVSSAGLVLLCSPLSTGPRSK